MRAVYASAALTVPWQRSNIKEGSYQRTILKKTIQRCILDITRGFINRQSVGQMPLHRRGPEVVVL